MDAEMQLVALACEMVIKSAITNLEKLRDQNYSRRPFQIDAMPWENFLLNMAPGAPDDALHRAMTEPISSFQMVPAVGLRVVADFEREEQEIIQFIRRARGLLNIRPAQTTLLIDFEKGTAGEEIPRNKMIQHTQRIVATPNPYRQGRSIREDVCIEPLQPVESVSHFLHRIESPNAPATGPRGVNNTLSFPLFSVRQWHAPTQMNDLRFFHRDTEA